MKQPTQLIVLISLIVSGFFVSIHVNATTLKASNKNATLAFSGEHAGMRFDGLFNKWRSELTLPPSKNPKITATFNLKSAETGDSTYDETLPEVDWFDVEQFPKANFTSTNVEATDGGFIVTGNLNLKGISNPVEFLLKTSAQGLNAIFEIDRLAYGIGIDSDPDAEWVSRLIKMELTIPSKAF